MAAWKSLVKPIAEFSTSTRRLLHALRKFEAFYNGHRPHQGIANARPLNPLPPPIADPDQIAHLDVRRNRRLDGILNEYRQVA